MFFLSFMLGVQSLLVAGIMPYVQLYVKYTFSANTVKAYGFYFWDYNRFCVLLGISLVSTVTSTLCKYEVFLARFLFLLPRSVCLYVNFVTILHKEHGFLNPLVNNWCISSVVKEICRVYGASVKTRLPISKEISLGIWSHLNLLNSRRASFWSIYLVSYFGLFRKAHLLSVSRPPFNPAPDPISEKLNMDTQFWWTI